MVIWMNDTSESTHLNILYQRAAKGSDAFEPALTPLLLQMPTIMAVRADISPRKVGSRVPRIATIYRYLDMSIYEVC